MKTLQASVTTRWTGGAWRLSRGALLASCGLVLACQSAPKNEAGPEVSKESAAPPAAAAPSTPAPAAPTPAAPAAVEPKGAEPPAALNAPVSAKSPTPAAKPELSGAPAASPSADAPVKAETKQGAVVSEEPFSLWLEAASPLAAGSASSVDVVLVAKAPYHTNAEYPHKFKLGAAPAGLSYPEAVVKGMDVKPDRSVLRVPVQAKQPGPATVSGTLSFSVCTEERCLVEKRDLSLALEVK